MWRHQAIHCALGLRGDAAFIQHPAAHAAEETQSAFTAALIDSIHTDNLASPVTLPASSIGAEGPKTLAALYELTASSVPQFHLGV